MRFAPRASGTTALRVSTTWFLITKTCCSARAKASFTRRSLTSSPESKTPLLQHRLSRQLLSLQLLYPPLTAHPYPQLQLLLLHLQYRMSRLRLRQITRLLITSPPILMGHRLRLIIRAARIVRRPLLRSLYSLMRQLQRSRLSATTPNSRPALPLVCFPLHAVPLHRRRRNARVVRPMRRPAAFDA